jgi:uncharacterized cupin superfamily protein
VRYLEISNRNAADSVHYPDVDLRFNPLESGGLYTRKNGTPY